jgi:hypothetical protein
MYVVNHPAMRAKADCSAIAARGTDHSDTWICHLHVTRNGRFNIFGMLMGPRHSTCSRLEGRGVSSPLVLLLNTLN